MKLILPNLEILDNQVIGVKSYYDVSTDTTYADLGDLLKHTQEKEVVYTYYYDIFMLNLEIYARTNNWKISPFSESPILSGWTRKQNYLAQIIYQNNENSDPYAFDARVCYDGKIGIHFLNVKNFIRGINSFNITPELQKEHLAVLKVLEKEGMEIYNANKGNRDASHPLSIAGFSRVVVGDPRTLSNHTKADINIETRSAMIGGLYYLKEAYQKHKILYDYDIRSLYPYLLVNMLYPDPFISPNKFDEFVPVVKDLNLALYRIKSIKAQLKPGHFPTLFTQKEQRQRITKTRLNILTDNIVLIRYMPEMEGWITSLDYDMILRDYDVLELTIDKTYLFPVLTSGERLFHKLLQFYDKKEEATGELRTFYKVILDSYSGSIAMKSHNRQRINTLTNIEPEQRIRIKGSDDSGNAYDIYAFMTAYGRKIITELALKAGKDNVVSIDTDGIFTTNRTLDKYCSADAEIGSLRLDKIMYNTQWFGQKQYEYQNEEMEWVPVIAGLPAIYYIKGLDRFEYPIIRYDKKLKEFVKVNQEFYLGLEEGTNHEK